MSGVEDACGAVSAKGDNSARPVRLRPKAPCPICAKPSVQRYHPFCSRRCADVDLSRWLSGRYAIPAEEPPESDDPDAPDTPPDDDLALPPQRRS